MIMINRVHLASHASSLNLDFTEVIENDMSGSDNEMKWADLYI